MENRIKDQQLDLCADYASSSDFDANQLCILLSGLAYVLIEGMRRMALGANELARATPRTIQLTLLRLGHVRMSNTLRVRLLLSHSHPDQALFRLVATALAPQPPWNYLSAVPSALAQARRLRELCPLTVSGVGRRHPEESSLFDIVRKHNQVAQALESWATIATSRLTVRLSHPHSLRSSSGVKTNSTSPRKNSPDCRSFSIRGTTAGSRSLASTTSFLSLAFNSVFPLASKSSIK